ncbi:RT24A protein, partial [Polypterus senegalus]
MCFQNQAGRVRVGKGNKPVTYEQALPPHYIGHRKGWLTQNTSNLDNEHGAAERIIEDVFIRKFIFGTFHNCLANEIVIKRRGNVIIICAFFLQNLSPQKYYFLIGYTETLLSHFYKCPVKMEVQTLQDKDEPGRPKVTATLEDLQRMHETTTLLVKGLSQCPPWTMYGHLAHRSRSLFTWSIVTSEVDHHDLPPFKLLLDLSSLANQR